MVYKETASSKSSQRIEFEQCRKALRSGDTLVVWRLNRLGRLLSDLVKIIGDLEREGTTFANGSVPPAVDRHRRSLKGELIKTAPPAHF